MEGLIQPNLDFGHKAAGGLGKSFVCVSETARGPGGGGAVLRGTCGDAGQVTSGGKPLGIGWLRRPPRLDHRQAERIATTFTAGAAGIAAVRRLQIWARAAQTLKGIVGQAADLLDTSRVGKEWSLF